MHDTEAEDVSSGPKPILNTSVLGRLLEELSWEGSSIRRYRHGGRGYDNVLTAEVLLALDFLPRQAFLGAVLRVAHGSPRLSPGSLMRSSPLSSRCCPRKSSSVRAGPATKSRSSCNQTA
jgi:hypothetical protein